MRIGLPSSAQRLMRSRKFGSVVSTIDGLRSAVFAPSSRSSADVVGRLVAQPGELQVGVVTAFVGAPVFIALVRRRRIAQL